MLEKGLEWGAQYLGMRRGVLELTHTGLGESPSSHALFQKGTLGGDTKECHISCDNQ